jgi:truncated hemoglobin YjbI
MSTIYDDIGGEPALEGVVTSFYDKVLADSGWRASSPERTCPG